MCPSRSRRWPIRDDTGPHTTFVGVRGRHCRFLSHVPRFSRAEIPSDVLTLLKMGRVTALRKPNGKIRGIVIGDIMRRLVARTIAQQVVLAVEEATAPFQYALSTKGGGECVAHAIQSLTELDPRATVLSVDGIGAFDLIARAQYLWGDDTGDTHLIEQGEGGEQGDPLMPLLFSLGQHSALQSLQSFLLPGEQLFAYLDDIYVVCSPERVGAIFTRLKSDLESHARIQVHQGKTKVWNRAGAEPEACSSMQEAAQRVDPDARVWTGDGPLSSKVSEYWGSQLALQSLCDHNWSRPV